jgi:3-isopropylmalate dehydratase small subunit
MKPFIRHCGIAAPLPLANVDTDQIVPKQFLKTVERRGLKAALFYDQRHAPDGTPIAGFVLDQAPWNEATILVAGDNFGCGSSREHAAWALADFGICCVISSRIADIFYNNSINNGLLPVTVPADLLAHLMGLAELGARLCVDLERRIIIHGEDAYPFVIDERVRARLLAGLDPIGEAQAEEAAIAAIEGRLAAATPWLPHPAEAEGHAA